MRRQRTRTDAAYPGTRFGIGAMRVVCGAFTAVGSLFLILVNQTGSVSVVVSVIPLAVIGGYLAVVRKRINAA